MWKITAEVFWRQWMAVTGEAGGDMLLLGYSYFLYLSSLGN